MKQQKKNWPAESNMTALKTLSHTLLHLDIQPTKMSPLVVKHPFTDSGLAGIYAEDGSLSVGNLLDSPDALRTWRENFSRRINEAETAMNLFCMITKPYQFGYLRLAAAHLSEQDMASFLSYAWISTESPNNDPNLSQRELLSMFRSLDPQKLMDQEEYTQFQNLDDVVTVYRGVTSYNANNIKALSWTLNREVVGLLVFHPAQLMGPLAALPLLAAAMHKPGSIGGGDIKFTAASGFGLGITAGSWGMALGLTLAALFYAINWSTQKFRRRKCAAPSQTALPLAPFLSLGFAIIYILNYGGTL